MQLAPLFLIGGPSAIAAYVVSRFAQGIDPRAPKLVIAVMLLIAAFDLYRRRHGKAPSTSGAPPPCRSVGRRLLLQVVVGLVLGAVSGLVGLLLGSLRLPTWCAWA